MKIKELETLYKFRFVPPHLIKGWEDSRKEAGQPSGDVGYALLSREGWRTVADLFYKIFMICLLAFIVAIKMPPESYLKVLDEGLIVTVMAIIGIVAGLMHLRLLTEKTASAFAKDARRLIDLLFGNGDPSVNKYVNKYMTHDLLVLASKEELHNRIMCELAERYRDVLNKRVTIKSLAKGMPTASAEARLEEARSIASKFMTPTELRGIELRAMKSAERI